MKYSYTNAQMRTADGNTIAAGTPSLILMERAGAALADAVERAMERLNETPLFVCGGGNNGGDGFAAARILRERGKRAEVLCIAKKYSDDCLVQKEKYGGEILGKTARRRYRFIVDCVLGTGITRAPEGDAAVLISFIRSNGAYVISADIPSGLSDGGTAFEPCVIADETVCMGRLKNCLLLADGADAAGKITVADIGIDCAETGSEIWEREDVLRFFPKKKSNSHKGTYGSACILAGDAQYSGAAFLAAEACLKSGAGYTRLCVSEPLYGRAVGKLPACVLKDFHAIDGEILSSDCIAMGMGAGISERLYVLIAELLRSYGGTLVLDADALNTLSVYGVEILKDKTCKVIITPHPKEFARLAKQTVAETLSDPIGSAKRFSAEYGVTVVLKNNRSVIAEGDRTAINVTGSPALAKGGSGDVLTGFLAGTCARGLSPFEGACVSCYLFGKAGEIAAEEMGEYSPDAVDVIHRISKAIMQIVG